MLKRQVSSPQRLVRVPGAKRSEVKSDAHKIPATKIAVTDITQTKEFWWKLAELS